ncbi:CBFD_NFYB_HMF domain-containing protein [Psidium guajava]|nr:CBFD_NFYB_HMF domain-containing protein [Psidium guajava]
MPLCLEASCRVAREVEGEWCGSSAWGMAARAGHRGERERERGAGSETGDDRQAECRRLLNGTTYHVYQSSSSCKNASAFTSFLLTRRE